MVVDNVIVPIKKGIPQSRGVPKRSGPNTREDAERDSFPSRAVLLSESVSQSQNSNSCVRVPGEFAGEGTDCGKQPCGEA